MTAYTPTKKYGNAKPVLKCWMGLGVSVGVCGLWNWLGDSAADLVGDEISGGGWGALWDSVAG